MNNPDIPYVIDTVDGDGQASNSQVLTSEEELIIPITVTTSTSSVEAKDITVEYDWSFDPGEAHLL